MPQRASVGDAEALEADAGVIGLTRGFSWGRLELGAVRVFIQGFSRNICFRVERYYCQDYSLLGEPVLAPKLYSDSYTGFPALGFFGDIGPKTTVSLVCLFCFLQLMICNVLSMYLYLFSVFTW